MHFLIKHNFEVRVINLVIKAGTDPEINQRGGWLMFQVGSFICIAIVSITIAAKFKDMKCGFGRVLP